MTRNVTVQPEINHTLNNGDIVNVITGSRFVLILEDTSV